MKVKKITYKDTNIVNEQIAERIKPVTISIVGFVIEENSEYITLTRELVGPEEFRSQVSIPKVSIIDEQDLYGANEKFNMNKIDNILGAQ